MTKCKDTAHILAIFSSDCCTLWRFLRVLFQLVELFYVTFLLDVSAQLSAMFVQAIYKNILTRDQILSVEFSCKQYTVMIGTLSLCLTMIIFIFISFCYLSIDRFCYILLFEFRSSLIYSLPFTVWIFISCPIWAFSTLSC